MSGSGCREGGFRNGEAILRRFRSSTAPAALSMRSISRKFKGLLCVRMSRLGSCAVRWCATVPALLGLPFILHARLCAVPFLPGVWSELESSVSATGPAHNFMRLSLCSAWLARARPAFREGRRRCSNWARYKRVLEHDVVTTYERPGVDLILTLAGEGLQVTVVRWQPRSGLPRQEGTVVLAFGAAPQFSFSALQVSARQPFPLPP